MLLELGLLLAKLLAGKAVAGAVAGTAAGIATTAVVKGTLFANAGLAAEITSTAIGLGVGEGIGNSIDKPRRNYRPVNDDSWKSYNVFEDAFGSKRKISELIEPENGQVEYQTSIRNWEEEWRETQRKMREWEIERRESMRRFEEEQRETMRWMREREIEGRRTVERIQRYLRDEDTGDLLDDPYNIHWEGKDLIKLLKQEAKFYDEIGKHRTAARYRKRLAEEESKLGRYW